MEFSLPGSTPDLKQAIERFVRQVLSFPLRLWRVATADLPTASTDNEGGILYDITTNRPAYSDGTNWLSLMPYTAGAALTRVDDTNVTVTLGGSPSSALLAATSITVGWSGTLAVSRGGLGVGTVTGLLQGNGTSAVTGITNSTTVGQVLRVTGSNTYAWGALDLSDTDAITGDLPLGNIAQITTLRVLGRTTAGTGDIEQLTITGTGNVVFSASPTITGTTTIATVNASALHTISFSLGGSDGTLFRAADTNANRGVRTGIVSVTASIQGYAPSNDSVQALAINPGGGAVTIGAGGLDVAGLSRCDSFRIDQAPTAATPTPTHTFTINLNGTVYRIPCVV